MPFEVVFDNYKELYESAFFYCDLLIISIPPKRNTVEAAFYEHKIKKIREAVLLHGVKRVLFISSTAVYGDHNTEVTEDTLPQPETASGKAILASENLLKENDAFSTTILRFGGLIGPGRDPARFFSGKKNIPNGKAPVNLIHLNDCIAITMAIIEQNAFGHVFNACSSAHPAKMDFYTQAALKSQLEAPEFVDELTNWKIVSSKYLESVLNVTATQPGW